MLQGRFEWTVGAISVAIVVTFVAWYAIVWQRPAQRAAPAAAEKAVADRPPGAEPRRRAAPPAPLAAPAVAAHAPVRSSARARPSASFTLVASRGGSWVQVREGSHTGRVLYEDELEQGELIRLRSSRLWVRFGAGSNVDLRINGYRAELPLFGTYDAFFTPRGARPDPVDHARAAQATAAQSP